MSTKKKGQGEIQEDDLIIVSTDENPSRGLTNPSQKAASITNLVEVLQSVDLDSSDAEANKTTISDNNGGRIELDEDLSSPGIIKK